jgi:uncharacterized protein (TIGR00661 family)
MKILYGVQGTGNGHITRARAMAKAFNERGIVIDYVFSGREKSQYFDMEVFGQFQSFKGLTFVCEQGAINKWATVKKASLVKLLIDIYRLDVGSYDLIINDFEPITAWAGKLQDVPVVNISHQAAFAYDKVPSSGLNFLNRWLLKYFAPSDVQLGVHWFHFEQPIIPPFIENIVSGKDKTFDFTLVYLPFESLAQITSQLALLTNKRFVIYHPEIDSHIQQGNLALCPPGRESFLADLERCDGVIANAGFELASEALSLGKRLLVKPLVGQFEQASNALTLKRLGYGQIMETINIDEISRWLEQQPKPPLKFPNDPSPLIDWLINGDYKNIDELSAQLWSGVKVADPAAH